MVEIQGKLLTKEMKEAMDLFVEKREVVNINPANPYLFERASATSVNQLGSWDVYRSWPTQRALTCKVHKPSQAPVKYIATVSQVLDLEDKELDWLAGHLGHDLLIHRE